MKAVAPSASRTKSNRKVYGYLLVLLLLIAAPYALQPFHTFLLTRILFLALASMSFVLLQGFGGMTSLAQATFYGVAGYVVGIGAVRYGWPLYMTLPAALVASTVVAAAFAGIAVRTRGNYFLMMTLALSQLFYGIALQWTKITGGFNGITGINPPVLFGYSLDGTVPMYFFALVPVALSFFLLSRLVSSPFGIALQGIRDDEQRMAALGYNVQFYRFAAITISGIFAGLAGVIAAYFYGLIGPDMVGLNAAVTIVFTSLLGGVDRFEGSFIGALVYVLLEDIGSQFTPRYKTLIGVCFVLIVLFLPKGITGLKGNPLQWVKTALSPKAGQSSRS
jgi:branched-chain amino acid transport system permease protein